MVERCRPRYGVVLVMWNFHPLSRDITSICITTQKPWTPLFRGFYSRFHYIGMID